MAAIPNQKTINETIKSQIDSLNIVVETIISAATKSKVLLVGSQINDSLENYKKTISTVCGKDGVITVIASSYETIGKLNTNYILKFKLNHVFKSMMNFYDKLHDFVNELANKPIDENLIKNIITSFEKTHKLFDEIGAIFSIIGKLSTPKFIGIKLLFLRFTIFKITLFILSLNTLTVLAPIIELAVLGLLAVKSVFKGLESTLESIDNMKITIGLFIKLMFLPLALKLMKRTVTAINEIASLIILTGGLKDTLILTGVFNMLESVFESVRNMKLGLFINFKIRRIIKALRLLQQVVRQVSRFKMWTLVDALISIILLKSFVKNLGLMFLFLILLTPVIILGVPALLVLIVAAFTLRIAMNIMRKILLKAATASIQAILYTTVITVALVIISAMFLLLALMADTLLESIWDIAKMILGIIIVSTLIVLFGALCGLATPILLGAMFGLGLLAVVVLLIFAIAAMLRFLQILNLDKDRIKENVQLVIDTCKMIIEAIFGTEDPESEESDKSWIGSIIGMFAESLKMVLTGIMAVAYLATMVVSILFIVLIATMLRYIQILDLDVPLIRENVNIVLDTCRMIINCIFKGNDEDAEESDKSWIVSIIEYIGGGLVSIIKGIMAVAYLALMVVAILFITLIATELRIIQMLDLDIDKIEENVYLVIDTCQKIINCIFDGEDKNAKESDKSWIVSVIEYIGGGLVDILKAIMAIAFLALMMVCILLITIIASNLLLIQNLDLDQAMIEANTLMVIEVSQTVINAITDPDDKPDKNSNKSWIRKLFEWIGADGLLQIIDVIMALAWLGFTLAIISLVKVLAEQLSYIGSIELNPNIGSKVDLIVNTANKVIASVTNRKEPISGSSDSAKMKILKWLFPSLAEAIEMMSKMKWVSSVVSTVGVVNQVAETLMLLNDLPDLSDVAIKTEKMCNTADEVIRQVTTRPAVDINEEDTRLQYLERINKVIRQLSYISPSGISKSERALSGHINLLKEINNVDLERLTQSAKLMEHISLFSQSIKGNFEGLADIINEKLLPILEDLKEIMGGVAEKEELLESLNNTENTSSNNSNDSSNNSNDSSNKSKDMTQKDIGGDEHRDINKYGNIRDLDGKRDIGDIISQLDEVIRIFKFDGAKVRI